MAKGNINVNVDITSDLHSLVVVDCNCYDCIYHQKQVVNCNLKQIIIDKTGYCTYYKESK